MGLNIKVKLIHHNSVYLRKTLYGQDITTQIITCLIVKLFQRLKKIEVQEI